MQSFNIFHTTIAPWLIIPLAYFLWVTALLFVKRIFLVVIKNLVKKTKTELDDILIRAADFPLTLIIFTSGGVVVEQMLPLVFNTHLTNYFLIAFKAVTIVAIVLFVDRATNDVLHHYADKVVILKSTGGVARVIVRSVVISLGLLILLDSFGISITPLIASLGIGSLAVALALQPTLENLFAGIQLVVDKPIELGHFIRLDSGEEGYVYRIGWRSTWVKLPTNNMIVIPNKLLVNSKVLNYYYPDTETIMTVEVGVHYESDLEQVERVTVEVAKEVLKEVAAGVKTFEPVIRYHTFDDYSINFTVVLRAREFTEQGDIKHEFIKRLHKRYAREGIVIPYPVKAVNYTQEKAFERNEDRANRVG